MPSRRPASLPDALTSPLHIALAALVLFTFTACSNTGRVVTTDYGTLEDGRTAHLFTLKNKQGTVARLTDFGATLVSLETADRDGKTADITIGYDTLEGWVNDGSYMGVTAGRYGNRIAKGKFTLDGKTFTLATNNDPNHLHGGNEGFGKKLWSAEPIEKEEGSGVVFTYVSPDGEEGYPGELTSKVTYFLDNKNQLYVIFEAETTKPTVINLVHHTYWNLTGDARQTILDHELRLNADGYVPTDATGIPNAGIQPVEGTPMDFRKHRRIGDRINNDHVQLKNGLGYDHCWAVNGEPGTMRLAAELYDPESGRWMQIETDQPGIQFYTGNYMDGSVTGKGGVKQNHRTGLCLETQVHPDSPNQPELSNAVLRPGQTYKHTMVHRFGAK